VSQGSALITVNVIAFERLGDARLHMEAWSSGSVVPLPRGRMYMQSTAPATQPSGSLTWKDRFEFHGLGAEAASAQAELLEVSTGQKEHDVRKDQTWPDLFPPVTEESVEAQAAYVFTHKILSGAAADHACILQPER